MYNIFLVWTGDNNLSHNRQNCIKQFVEACECNVTIITTKNLKDYILPEHPLHPAYEYLSYTHRADYLRTYLMNFYGGGYSDIKRTTGSWRNSFDKLRDSEDKWIIGYKEIGPWGVAGTEEVRQHWEKLVGNGCYICKPQTELTKEWYSEMLKVLDEKLEKLKEFPATSPQDCSEISNGKYPMGWNEMLGRIFHRISLKYHDKLINTLPICDFNNYR